MSSRRSRRILEITRKNEETIHFLNWPLYETTSGTSEQERDIAIKCFSGSNDDNEIEAEEKEPFSDSGSEYVPSNGSVIDETTSDGELDDLILSVQSPLQYETDLKDECIVSSTTEQKIKQKSFKKPSMNNEEVSSSEDINKITITYNEKVNDKRFRNKCHACYFCHKLLQNMSRHFETKHKDELEIIRISILPKNSKERRNEYNLLLKAGDFYHNCEVLTTKTGELILARRPSENEFTRSYSSYGPCPKCLGFMLKSHIWHHMKYNCLKSNESKEDDEELKTSRLVIAESNALINGILDSDYCAGYYDNIIEKLRNDEVGNEIKNDNLILRFGAFLYEKYGSVQSELIRQNMRQLGRLLLELKKINPSINSLSDSLTPNYFDTIIQATKQLCIRSESNGVERPTFGIPSLALKIGHALKKCIGIQRGQALRKCNIKSDKLLTSFDMLLSLEWNVKISSNALASLHNRKLNHTELMPVTSDLLKLSKFLEVEIKETTQSLQERCSTSEWLKLTSLTLARIILFNKRRSGEAARMTVEQYLNRPSWESRGTDVLKGALSPFEQKLAKKLFLINIIGKRGRHVPVILSSEMKETIDLLITLRPNVDIVPNNPFLFALGGGSLKNMRGHDVLKKWCLEADLECPQLVTGTKLRKYIATVCQLFNLTENETDWLARHLGHDIRVHRDFYRLHDNAVELAKISRLLLAIDQGDIKKFAGKNLEDINPTDLPEVEENCESEDTDGENENSGKSIKEIEISEGTSKENEKSRKSIEEIETGEGASKEKNKTAERKNGGRKKVVKRPWSSDEASGVLNFFRTSIKRQCVPGKKECEKCLNENPALSTRKWTDIKFYVKNQIDKNKKKMRS